MLAQPVCAQTVYYCVMTNAVDITADRTTKIRSERFKMEVDVETITFGSDGIMRGMEMTSVNLFRDGSFVAESHTGTARFAPPEFFYSAVFEHAITSFHATCDQF